LERKKKASSLKAWKQARRTELFGLPLFIFYFLFGPPIGKGVCTPPPPPLGPTMVQILWYSRYICTLC
jgi:hypothetical protein